MPTPIGPPAFTGDASFVCLTSPIRHASYGRWRSAAQDDGSGLGRPELERLNSIMDMRITNLSDQLAALVQSKHVRLSSYSTPKKGWSVNKQPIISCRSSTVWYPNAVVCLFPGDAADILRAETYSNKRKKHTSGILVHDSLAYSCLGHVPTR